MKELTLEEIKLLAEQERRMDAGEVPYVIWSGNRFSVDSEILQHFNLKNQQTINDAIALAIMKFNITRSKEKIMEEEKKEISTAKPEDFEDEK